MGYPLLEHVFVIVLYSLYCIKEKGNRKRRRRRRKRRRRKRRRSRKKKKKKKKLCRKHRYEEIPSPWDVPK